MRVIYLAMLRCLITISSLILLSGCENNRSVSTARVPTTAAELGELIFHDMSLSASGKQSCASCHSPEHAHAQPNALSVQMGGVLLDQPGTRAVPSLRYLNKTPSFSVDKEGTPSGGFNHDGSAETLSAQVERPLLAANEMANGTRTQVIEKIRQAAYVGAFKKIYGEQSLDRVDVAFAHVGHALQQYQLEDDEFFPFDSKYDLYLAGKVELSSAEMRGLKLFNDKKRANCAACHPSAKDEHGGAPLFTDFTYDALGLPRNEAISANINKSHFDLGLCTSGREGRVSKISECGKFKVPTLRNVATRKVFFHNGQIKSLREAVAFYIRRDTHPHEWYPIVNGTVQKFNDLPKSYHKNITIDEAPYDRKLGQQPVLSEQDIDDVVAFLHTLTDGYREPQKQK